MLVFYPEVFAIYENPSNPLDSCSINQLRFHLYYSQMRAASALIHPLRRFAPRPPVSGGQSAVAVKL